MHSKSASTINKKSKYWRPTVLSIKALASGLAGLAPTSFKKPNQKNTKNTAKRSKGIYIRPKKSIILRSRETKSIFLFAISTISIIQLYPNIGVDVILVYD